MLGEFDLSIRWYERVVINVLTVFGHLHDALFIRPPKWQRELWKADEQRRKLERKLERAEEEKILAPERARRRAERARRIKEFFSLRRW